MQRTASHLPGCEGRPYSQVVPRQPGAVARDLTGPPDKLGSDIVTAGDCGQDRAIEAVKYALAADFSPVINWALIDMPDYESADEEEKALMLGFFKGLTELAV